MKPGRTPAAAGLLFGLGVFCLALGLNARILRHPGSIAAWAALFLCCYALPLLLALLAADFLAAKKRRPFRAPGKSLLTVLICLLLFALFISNYLMYGALLDPGAKAYFILLMALALCLPAVILTARAGLLKRPGRTALQIALPLLIAALIFLFPAGGPGRGSGAADAAAGPVRIEPAEKAWRVFFLALDGADWACLDPLLERGMLPAFAELLENGASARLKTLTPTFSPIIWTSIATGKTPQKHGIFNFGLYRLKGPDRGLFLLPKFLGTSWITEKAKRLNLLEFVPVTSNMRRSRALWNILSEAGYSTGVVNWLVTMPAEKVRGFMVSEIDYLTFMKAQIFDTCYPPGLLSSHPGLGRDPGPDFPEIFNGLFGGAPPDRETKNLRLLKAFLKQDCMKIRTGRYLFDAHRPDFFTLYLHGLDAAQHFFWREKDLAGKGADPAGSVVPAYYRFLDRTLDSFVDRLDDRTVVVVCSDHGFRSPVWLEEKLLIRNKNLSGVHEFAPDGILIMAGAPVKKGLQRKSASIYDVAPTLLTLMGLPAAEDMDGRILADWLKAEAAAALSRPPVASYDAGWTYAGEPLPVPADEAKEEKLKALGYIF
jgi:predicted AlkP superfamily phosphohydrolase/phosphomutase